MSAMWGYQLVGGLWYAYRWWHDNDKEYGIFDTEEEAKVWCVAPQTVDD